MRTPLVVRLVALGSGALVLAGLLPATAAFASASSPAVGECFAITNAQSYEDYWPTSAPVSCHGPHSIEIVMSGALPADVNAFDFASGKCDVTEAWAKTGVNQAVGGIVRNPLRIEAFPFAVRGGAGERPAWVCGLGPVAFRGSKDDKLIKMSGSLARMSAASRASLRYCASAARGRDAFAPPITVPCSTTPRWQVPTWIMWGDLYSTYPGEAVIKARAARLCPLGSTFSYPTAADWPTGSRRSFCYVKHT
jgi:hypothetical protein